jgi:NAD(P)-dependent dehydrogenase (short-subunit alcohol dehydrogenase family)
VTDRVVLITGANNGIGHHMALRLLDLGWRVGAFDLSGENLENARKDHPGRFRFHPCDVTDEAAVVAAVRAIASEWKRIDVLVNNACVAMFGPFETKELKDTRAEFEVNYFGYVNMLRAVLPYMKAQGEGVIHNVSSTVGITGFPGIYGYASTKGAIEALTRTLAIELRPCGVTVNLMHPTITNTRSAAPLGLPSQAMADPAVVGKGLARRVGSKKAILTADVMTSIGVFMARHFPEGMGRLMALMSARAKQADA